MFARWEGFGEIGEKCEGMKECELVVNNSQIIVTVCKIQLRNIVNNITISMYGVRWVLDLSGKSLLKLCKCLIIE